MKINIIYSIDVSSMSFCHLANRSTSILSVATSGISWLMMPLIKSYRQVLLLLCVNYVLRVSSLFVTSTVNIMEANFYIECYIDITGSL